MKASLIIFLIVLLPSICKSQIRSSIDLIGGVEYSYRDLITSPSLSIDRRNEEEKGKMAWRAGFNYNLRFTNNVVLKTGVRYANIGYITKDQFRIGLWAFGDIVHIMDYILPDVQLNLNVRFLEIPIAVRYEFSQKKIAPFVELGGATSIYLGGKRKLISDSEWAISFLMDSRYAQEKEYLIEAQKKVHLVGIVSFGANYNVSEKFQLFGQSIFRYHFTALVNEPVKENLFNGGLEVGLRKKIN